MKEVYKWGIIGPGKIAAKFAAAIPMAEGAVLHAVASRDEERAKEFAERFNISVTYDSYDQLAGDPEIDAVYIATPHAFHAGLAVLCLKQGKAVLCEKPLALNATQVKAMIAASRENKAFLMEAMWTRFLPVTEAMLDIIRNGGIGRIHSIRADFGFNAPYNPESRLFNLALGGGSLLDVGVYPLFLILLLLGKPLSVKAAGRLAPTGADESCRAVLRYPDGAEGMMVSALNQQTFIIAEIEGADGRLTVAAPWYKTNTLTWQRFGDAPQTITLDTVVHGFEYQIREVQQCLERGQIESQRMPHNFSLLLSETTDEIRKQIGVVYPADGD
jgi:predicted dehydrogenase